VKFINVKDFNAKPSSRLKKASRLKRSDMEVDVKTVYCTLLE